MNKAYARKRDDYGRPPSLHEISLSFGDIVRSQERYVKGDETEKRGKETDSLQETLIDLQFNPAPETAGNRTSENINHKQEIW